MRVFICLAILLSSSTMINGFQNRPSHLSKSLIGSTIMRTQIAKRMAEEKDETDLRTFFIGNEGEFSADLKKVNFDWNRFVSFNLLAVALAFGSNFVGITSVLMSNTKPEVFRSAGLDQLYSIGGYRRHVDTEDKYEYIFPENWLFDREIMLADARERDMPKMLRDKQPRKVRPDSAYGPANKGMSFGETENLSVIKSNVQPGFTLKGTLGEPREAAERLLQNVIAAPGSGKSYVLLDASENKREGVPAYVFEYTIKKEGTLNAAGVLKGGFYQHSISVVMSRGNELYTFTGVAPENKWEEKRKGVEISAKSFKIAAVNIPEGFY
jgi:hypothetical protein